MNEEHTIPDQLFKFISSSKLRKLKWFVVSDKKIDDNYRNNLIDQIFVPRKNSSESFFMFCTGRFIGNIYYPIYGIGFDKTSFKNGIHLLGRNNAYEYLERRMNYYDEHPEISMYYIMFDEDESREDIHQLIDNELENTIDKNTTDKNTTTTTTDKNTTDKNGTDGLNFFNWWWFVILFIFLVIVFFIFWLINRK